MSERLKTIERLKKAIAFKSEVEKSVNDVTEVSETIENINEVVEEVSDQDNKELSTISENPVKEEGQPIDLFEELGKGTEEDSDTGKGQNKAESILENITDSELANNEDLDSEEDSPQFRKEMANIKAVGIVEIIDLIFCVLCMWISGDWSKDAQEKKYTLTSGRKKVLVISIMRIMIAKKKKTNPTTAIIGVAVASFIPMLLIAIMAGISKRREKQEAAQEAKKLAAMQSNNVQAPNVYPLTPRPIPIYQTNQINVDKQKKGKQGRHKKNCSYYINKKCNCK